MSIACLSAAVAVSRAHADQPIILSLASKDFIESLTDKPRVVGNLLVGLNWDTPSVSFEPAQITIQPPSNGEKAKACLAVASQDGHYSARNLFDIPANAGSTASFDYKTSEGPTLARYVTSRIGVVVRTAKTCDDPQPGPLIPVSLRSTAAPRTALAAKINADAKDLTLRLERPGTPALKSAPCRPAPEGTGVAFRAECTIAIDVPLVADTYTLTIEIKELFRSDKTSFKVQIR